VKRKVAEAILPGFHLSDEESSSLDEKTIESIAEIIIRIMLGELPEFYDNSLSFDWDDEDEDGYELTIQWGRIYPYDISYIMKES
jgi:hypothetical protein